MEFSRWPVARPVSAHLVPVSRCRCGDERKLPQVAQTPQPLFDKGKRCITPSHRPVRDFERIFEIVHNP